MNNLKEQVDKFHQHEALHTAHVLICTWDDFVVLSEYVANNKKAHTACVEACDAMAKAYRIIGEEDFE